MRRGGQGRGALSLWERVGERALRLLSSASLLLACAGEPSAAPSLPCPPPTGDTKEIVAPRHARNFDVEYVDGATLVTVRNPWRGAGHAVRYLLLPCGVDPPPGHEDATPVRVPVRSVVTTSTTQLAHLVSLDATDRLVGHDELDYVNAPEIRRRIESGAIAEVGDGSRANLEVLLQLRPDVVFAFASGNPDYDLPSQVGGAEVNVVLSASYMEPTPLGRSEWIKFTSLFLEREAEANRVFAEIAASYESLAALARGVERRPGVLVGAPFRGVWHVSGGRSFTAQLIADAGGRYLWEEDDSAGGLPLDFETVYARASEAEVWINTGLWQSLEEGLAIEPRFAGFAAMQSGRVYNNNRRLNRFGGNDFWESGTLRADRVLADLVAILHPQLLPDHDLVYYRRLE